MNIIKIIPLSLGSLAILFLLTKLMGNREMSQLTMFDYIVGITIGSVAAEMSTSLENKMRKKGSDPFFLRPLFPYFSNTFL